VEKGSQVLIESGVPSSGFQDPAGRERAACSHSGSAAPSEIILDFELWKSRYSCEWRGSFEEVDDYRGDGGNSL
jgi:hypothetical protein